MGCPSYNRVTQPGCAAEDALTNCDKSGLAHRHALNSNSNRGSSLFLSSSRGEGLHSPPREHHYMLLQQCCMATTTTGNGNAGGGKTGKATNSRYSGTKSSNKFKINRARTCSEKSCCCSCCCRSFGAGRC